MKALPFSYIARNLRVRRVTTVLTAAGMALVVYVFATVLMMTEGIRATLVATGQPDNVIVLRKGAGAEINSGISRSQAAVLETLPGIALGPLGGALVSKEPVVLNNLPKRGIGFRSLTENIDTTTSGGMLVFNIFGSLAQFERDLIRERTHAGLKAARERGNKGGRRPVVTPDKLRKARAHIAAGLTVREAAARLKIGKTALYKALENA